MNSDETIPHQPEGDSTDRAAGFADEARGPLPRGTPPKFGRYETWRVLGHGAFGRVYLAFDDLMERFVAIKAPKDALPTEKHRAFLREARAISEIHHAHVCPVYDVGIEDDLPFLVMKFVRGGTLADLVGREPPTPDRALEFVGQIAQGLDAVHARGIFHRDLKPANVLYDAHEKKLLLTDFGVARWADESATLRSTGTPLYMAPEQWGGEFGVVSARTDVYALGVMLFEFLTRERLFDGTAYSLLGQHCSAPPRKPSEVRPALGSRYDALCLKALAKKQDDRYESATALAAAAAALLRPPAREWDVTVPGTWYERPAGDGGADWREVASVPATVTEAPGMVYRLSGSGVCRDWQLSGLAHLKDLPAFVALELENCTRLTDAGLSHLKGLTGLTALNLAFCTQLTDAGLAHLKTLTGLHTLNLIGYEQLTDAGLAHLKRLTALSTLKLGNCTRLTDAGLAHLKRLTSLTALKLAFCKHLTDVGLAHLKTLTALQTLDMAFCERLTDAGLAHLKGLTALTTLNLAFCERLTDAGLAHLHGLTALTKLNVGGCPQVTDAGVAALQAALPNCHIKR